jgi:hypothetical protein
MKKLKKVQKEVEVIDKYTCDICECDMTDKEPYNSTETTIEAKIGNFFPEGDFRKKYSIDVCGNCFEDRIIPLIESKFKIKFNQSDV